MGYIDVQSALTTVIKKINSYDGSNVVVDDYDILRKGHPDRAVILRRGESEHEELTMGAAPNIGNTWTINAELYVASSPRGSDLANQTVVESQKIVDEVRKWPNLDSTTGVINVEIQRVGEPEEGDFGGGRARSKWWRQFIAVQVQEIVAVTLSE